MNKEENMLNRRIAVVIGCNIHWAPYYYKYEKLLLDNECDFDVIMWNREGLTEKIQGNRISFDLPDASNNHDPKKIYKFFAFSRFVKKTIKEGKYDKIIFLGLQGCALPLNAYFFKTKYNQRYWVDIRDYHYEWFKPYYILENVAIQNSRYAVVSSSGFESFLPPYNYGRIHNVDPMMQKIVECFSKCESDKIRISFIGNVRYFDENVRILNLLGNDDRYFLQYFGPGGEKLEAYCKEQKIQNVSFEGAFPREKTKELYEKTDIINNVYGNSLIETKTALSNKLYYALYLELPILVSPDTFMQEISEKYNISFAFRDNSYFADELYTWYKNFLKKKPECGFAALRQKVEIDDFKWKEMLTTFVEC